MWARKRSLFLRTLSGAMLAGSALASFTPRILSADPAPISTQQPSTAVNFVVEQFGIYQNLGMINMFGGNFAPGGSLEADGSLLQISQNDALFSQLGTTYGGDGNTTFALPDLRGRLPIGMGQGAGLSDRSSGETTGVNQITLTNAQMPVSAGGGGQPFTNMQPSLALNYAIATQGVFPSQGGGGSSGGGNSLPMIGQILITATPGTNLQPGELPLDGRLLPINQNQALFSVLGTTYGGNGTTNFALPDLRGRAPIGVGSGIGLTPRLLGQTLGTESTTLSQSNLPAPQGTDEPFSNMQPVEGLNYIIALQGIYPSRGGGGSIDNNEPILGQISLFAGNFAPSGWALCNGQSLSIAQNTALFSILGTFYGGNGITTFDLPDLQGRVPLGFDPSAVPLGSETGTETITLSPDQIPVPEPASLGAVVIAASVGLLRRRSSPGR